MKRLLALAFFELALIGCNPSIKKEAPPPSVTANFDPAAVPPVVPSPNDLAQAANGQVTVTPGPHPSAADLEFVAYLNSLNGFTPGTTATTTFSGGLNTSTVTPSSVVLFDITDPNAFVAVTDAVIGAGSSGSIPGEISALPPLGWKPGHRYMVAVIGGNNGVRGAHDEPVIGSATWFLVRGEDSLVSGCSIPAPGQGCVATTNVIPTTESDPQKQNEDRANKAIQLEQLRLKYKPLLDFVVTSAGVKRNDIAILWSFEIGTNPSPVFDPAAVPPRVPQPTDLAIDPTTGLVNAPIPAGAPPAQAEFIRDYLNTLNGFPQSSQGMVAIAGGALNPSSVNAGTVRVIDLTAANAPADAGIAPAVPESVTYSSTTQLITICPPNPGSVAPPCMGSWPKDREIAVVLVGGTNGLKGVNGETVVASQVWALARSSSTLVTCTDLADPTCASTVSVTALTKDQAVSLEQLRRGFTPLLDQLAALPPPAQVTRDNVALAFNFHIMNHPEAPFNIDPSAPPTVIPFPNDLLVNPSNGLLALPNPTANPLVAGLNTLDGFSTTGAPITENSDTMGAFTEGRVNPATLDGGTAFVKLSPGGLPPIVHACLNCTSSLLRDGGTPTSPDQIQFVPVAPLDEKSSYAAVLKTTAADMSGRQVRPKGQFVLLRMENPLVVGGHSAIAGVTDAQASALEPVRQQFKPLFDALNTAGIPRSQIALGWNFRTQSIIQNSVSSAPGLQTLHDFPATLDPTIFPTSVAYLIDIRSPTFPPSSVPQDHIDKVYTGAFTSPLLLGAAGTFTSTPTPTTVPFLLITPTGTPPSGGFPVVVFGHGITRSRLDVLAIANAFATAGFASIATDTVWHGERSTCVGSTAATHQASDNASCQVPGSQKCDETPGATFGRCIAQDPATATACDHTSEAADVGCAAIGQGRCLATDLCEGGDFLRDATGQPVISGWNMIQTVNLFATRDNFRQQVIDLSQLNRVLKATGTGTITTRLGSGVLNTGTVHYAGQSLGGCLGALYTAVAPEITNAALNVPAGDLPTVILQSPSFAASRNAFLDGLQAEGIFEGTPAFDQFIYFARTILDPATPTNVGFALSNGQGLPGNRSSLIQYITQDQTIPNASTLTLIAAATRPDVPKKTFVHLFDPDTDGHAVPLASRHGFLINGSAETAAGQSQMVQFLLTGTIP